MRRSFHQRILWLVILGTFLGLVCQNDIATEKNSHNIVSQTPQPSESAPKIVIDGINPSLDWETCPWDNGTGTIGNPYILKDLVIDAGGVGSGILIQNTRDYFQIQNCTVLNSSSTGAGIYLDNVTFGTLFNNNITANEGNGIYMYNSHNCSILANNITQNAEHGLELYNTDANNFTGNRLILNQNYAFYTQYADNCSVQDNYFDRNYNHAIRWCYGQYSNFTGNAIYNQTGDSIDLFTTHFNQVTGNRGNNDSGGIRVRESHDNIVMDNNFTTITSTGMGLDTATRTFCKNNSFTGGSFGISIYDSSSNNSILEHSVSNAQIGMSISGATNTIVSGNHFAACGIRLQGSLSELFSHTIGTDNDIGGNLVRVYENQTGVAIPVDTGQAILVNCSASYFEDAQSNPAILSFYYTNHSLVKNCTVAGLDLYNTLNNTLTNNSFSRSFNYSAGIRVYYSQRINVTRNDLNRIPATCGIYLYYANNCTVHQNNCSRMRADGIWLEESNYNNVTNNTCDDIGNGGTWLGGIYMYSGNYNNILWNNCSRTKGEGIRVGGTGNLVEYNNCSFNSVYVFGFGIYGGGQFNIIRNNKCRKNYYGIQLSTDNYGGELSNNECWENDAQGIVVCYTHNANLTGNRCWDNNEDGIRLGVQADYCTVTGNWAYSNTYYGIEVEFSSNNTLIGNNCTSNTNRNFYVHGTSHGNRLFNNTAQSGWNHGIEASYANNTVLVGNNCTNNDDDGIFVYGSNNCTVANNTCSGHTGNRGIYASDMTNSTFTGNNLTGNDYGLYFPANSLNNILQRNFCTNNDAGIYLSGGCDNNLLLENNCTKSAWYGIYIGSNGNNLTRNNASYNPGVGITVLSDSNYISWNNCSKNTGLGMGLNALADYNEVCYNFARNNGGGNFSDGGTTNYVHHNFFGDGPYAYFTTNATNILEGQWISFTDASFGGASPYIYNWSFGDLTANSTFQNPPAHQYTTAAVYVVNLIIEDTYHALSNYSIEISVSGDIPPVASFDANPMSIISGQWVQFNDTSIPGNGPLQYQWNFGDGPVNNTTQNVTHQYNAPNTYSAVLTVNDTDGDVSVFSRQITVVADNVPVASFIANWTSIRVNQWVRFNDTSIPGNGLVGYQWYFGDLSANETTQNVTHQFTSASVFTVFLTVNDTDGDFSIFSLQITVTVDVSPVSSFGANPMSIYEGQWVQFNDTSTGGNRPLIYQWNFGDGPTNTTTQNVTHQFLLANTYTVILTVNDTDGDVSVFSMQITVTADPTNYPPSIAPLQNLEYQFGSLGHVVSITITDQKVNNPTLTIYLDGVVIRSNQAWVSQAAFQFNIDGLGVGTHLYKVVASDGLGGSSMAYFNVTVLPDPLLPLWIILGIAIPIAGLGTLVYWKKFRRPRGKGTEFSSVLKVATATMVKVEPKPSQLPQSKYAPNSLSSPGSKTEPSPVWRTAWDATVKAEPKTEPKSEPPIVAKIILKPVSKPIPKPGPALSVTVGQSQPSPKTPATSPVKEPSTPPPSNSVTRKAAKKSKKPAKK